VLKARLPIPARDALIALSLSNLCYLKVWPACLDSGGYSAYFSKLPPSPARIAALFLNVLVLAGLFLGAALSVRLSRSGKLAVIARVTFVAVCLVPLNAARAMAGGADGLGAFNEFFHPGNPGSALRFGLLAGCGFCVLVFLTRPLARLASVVLLVLSPFVLVTFGEGAIQFVRYDPAPFRDQPLASRLSWKGNHLRVVWIIFDEMDQRLAFVDREPSLELKEFDRLRAEALYADNAYPPAGDTAESIPSLTMGRVVERTAPHGPSDLELYLKGGGYRVRWSDQPTVFSRARQSGFNVAVVGWYHPYCRQFSASLTDCWWGEFETETGSTDAGFGGFLVNQARSIVETERWAPLGPTVTADMRVQNYRAILGRAQQAVSDPSLDLVFLHLPVPHAPFVYDRTTGGFRAHGASIHAYWDALALADRTLGELRRSMERAGTWNHTAVLISADHHFRQSQELDGKSDPRVPFLLRLGGQEAGTVFHREFNTVLTQGLLLALLSGEVESPEAVSQWMARHAEMPDLNATYTSRR
jgi:Sulfatase